MGLNMSNIGPNPNTRARAKKVNDIYDEYSRKGYTNAWIFRNHVHKQFNIAYRTFYRWLKIEDFTNNKTTDL